MSSKFLARCRLAALVLLLPFLFSRPAAAAIDFTDLWWNPAESGWGVTFTQADDFLFATFFIHGPSLEPVWYTGQLTRASNGVWSGPLYLTAASYFGAPWNPAQTANSQVGTATFTPASEFNGTLTYNVGAFPVFKHITRQTLQTIAAAGSYLGGIVTDVTNCSNPLLNQTTRLYADFTVTQVPGSQLQIDFFPATGGTYRMAGLYIQDGQLFRIPSAAYTGPSLSTTASVSKVKVTSQGFEGQWVATVNGGCTENGYFSAVLR